jgi:hypothetical protein
MTARADAQVRHEPSRETSAAAALLGSLARFAVSHIMEAPRSPSARRIGDDTEWAATGVPEDASTHAAPQ